MSSFLDLTGLDRLATKLKAYFMKKPTTASTSSYPLVGYDATNNVGKYNSDITMDMANREILAGNSTPNLATPTAPYSNDISIRTVTRNVTYTSLYHKPTKDMYVLVRNGGSAAISVIYGTPSSQSSKSLSPGYMVLLLYTTSNETWSLVTEPALSGGTYPNMTVGNATNATKASQDAAGNNFINANDGTTRSDYVFQMHPSLSTGGTYLGRLTYTSASDRFSAVIMVTATLRCQDVPILAFCNIAFFGGVVTVAKSMTIIGDNTNHNNLKFYFYVDSTNKWVNVYLSVSSPTLSSITPRISVEVYHNNSTTFIPIGTSISNLDGLTPIDRSCVAFLPEQGTQVGSTNRPVYVKSDGSVEACFTGINTIATAGNQYYKLADITFSSDNADIVYAGVQIAATWRNGNGDTGSGIVGITFSEYGTGAFGANVAGRVLVTYDRSNGANFLKNNQIFIVQKNTNYSYTLLLYNSGPQCLSYSLLSGGCTAFTVPSTATVVTPGSNLTKLPYFVPSGTTYTPT